MHIFSNEFMNCLVDLLNYVILYVCEVFIQYQLEIKTILFISPLLSYSD